MTEQAKVVEAPVESEFTEVELQAKEQGWVPKAEWKGAEEDWTPAKAFIKYGQVESELKKTRSEASQKEKVIKSMKDYYLNVKEDAKKEILDTIKRQKREAIKNEDYVKVAELDLQLDEMTDNLDRKFKKSDEELGKAVEQPAGPPPEFFEWNKKNTWYTMGANDELTKEADVLAVAYTRMNPNASYPDVLEYVEKRVKKLFPEKFMPKEKDQPAAVNEPGESVGDRKSKKAIKLSDAEKQAAEAFGLSYEDYAKSMKEWDTKKGVVIE